MIQEHWLFYRVATNVLFDPGHINLAIFYSYDTVKDVVADFKVIFETQTSFKILVKWEKTLLQRQEHRSSLYIKFKSVIPSKGTLSLWQMNRMLLEIV